MRGLEVIHGGAISLGSAQSESSRRLQLVHGLRSGLLISVFLLAILFQLMQGEFLAPSIWLPVYAVMAVVFLCNSAYFLFWSDLENKKSIHGFLFGLDALAITMMVHHTGAASSLFFFLYLVDIILAGLVFQRRGAFTQALWTSLLYGILLLVSPSTGGENLYFLATLNNLAFFSVAYLSGNLSEQINFMGDALTRTVRRLEHLQDLNKVIVENIGTGLLTVSNTGEIMSANPAASRTLDGLNLEGRALSQVFPGLHLESNVVSLHGNHSEIRQMDVEFLNRNRQKQIIEVVISPLKDDKGEQTGHVVMFQDRTEVKRLESAMRQKEKLAAVGQLAAGIAHEIRNPLASLSGSVQLMISQPEKYGEEDLKLMRIITREIDRLNGLITEFLEYVRPEAKPEQVVDLNKVIREVLEMIRFNSSLNSEIEQIAELKGKQDIFGHEDKLKQALLNIVINSCQSMAKSNEPVLKVETFDVQDRFVVKISDNGHGMDEATRLRIFEPFFTTKPKGTGLGLAVTHKILEVHDAVVRVESQPGVGTAFILDFPGVRDTLTPDRPFLREAK